MDETHSPLEHDALVIEDLEVFTSIGVHDFEHRAQQKVLVSLELRVGPIDEAARQDNLALTLNWAKVCEMTAQVAAEKPRKLIETLAFDLSEAILRSFPVLAVSVHVKKLSRTNAKSLGVRIRRERA